MLASDVYQYENSKNITKTYSLKMTSSPIVSSLIVISKGQEFIVGVTIIWMMFS